MPSTARSIACHAALSTVAERRRQGESIVAAARHKLTSDGSSEVLTAAKRLRHLPLTISVSGVDLHAFEGPGADSSFVTRALDHVAAGGEIQLGSTLSLRVGYNGRKDSIGPAARRRQR